MLSMLDDPGADSTGKSAEQEMLFNLEKEVADINAKIKVSFSYIWWVSNFRLSSNFANSPLYLL